MNELFHSKESAIFYAICSLVMVGLIIYALLALDLSDGINLFMVALGLVLAVFLGRQAIVCAKRGEAHNG